MHFSAIALVLLGSTSFIFASPLLRSSEHHANIAHSKRSPPNGWSYLGCFAEPSTGARLLTTKIAKSGSLTQESCMAMCIGANYSYAAMEFGAECWCGNKPTAPMKLLPDTACNSPCSGDSGESCGQAYIATLFGKSSVISSTWSYIGCYTDDNQRTLPFPVATPSSTPMTTSICQSSCQAAGYTYGGTETGTECWCANSLVRGTKVADSKCSTPCVGDSSAKCGAPWTILVYGRSFTAGWSTMGCYLDDGTTRALTGASFQDRGMTQAMCQGMCAGYSYSATEFGVNCYCGNSLARSVKRADSECSIKCGGDGNAMCGGSYRMTLSSAL